MKVEENLDWRQLLFVFEELIIFGEIKFWECLC